MPNKIYRPHFSTTSDARVVRTREALRKAMLDLLSTKPFEQITIRELAADAGIGYTTFFRHHPTKESLLEEIATEEIRQLIDYTLVTFNASDTDTASLALCQYVDQHRTLWSTLLTGGAASALRDEFVRVAQEVAAHTPEQSDWLPAEFGVILVASSTIELLAWWLRQDDPMPLEKIAEIYRRAVLGPVFTLQENAAEA
ncbi:TetR/AcrR family transcriptional regulator [Litorivivens sp.]|uniref:TetR/AcrR family transcriptional regulator n=2 Tax=Litorivivens sp. TaxID=2020868 RepID=UPI0035646060